MKIKLLLVFIITFLLSFLDIFAQSNTTYKLPELIPYRKGDKWGFCLLSQKSDKGKKIIIPCIYDRTDRFMDGLALVKLNGKYGFVNKEGKEIISLKYDDAGNFKEGLAPVKLNNKWGYINIEGKEVIPLKFDSTFPEYFNEGLAKVKKEIDRIKTDDSLFSVHIYKYGFINKEGKEVIPFKYDDASDFSEGLARVLLNHKEGFINKEGKVVIPFKY